MSAIKEATPGNPAYREVELDLHVSRRETAAEGVVALGLADPDGEELPEWTPGAHIDLVMGEGLTRQYSLCGSTSNRDENVFPDPHKFDITREGLDQHQAFGGRGRHFCLGANLARLELKLWIQQTLERFPDLELDSEPTRVRALFLNQYNSIPVRRSS